MTLSELCIRRPVMTILLCLAVIVTGIALYPTIPIAALPSFNSPVIQVTATLPGASPETMAASVATQLEKQCTAILECLHQIDTRSQNATRHVRRAKKIEHIQKI